MLSIHQIYIWLDCESHGYGLNCSFDCGHCKDGRPCSTVTGNCHDGCEDGWIEKLCDIGKSCKKCIIQATTNIFKGSLLSYCISILFLFSLIEECKNGTYISNGKCVKCQGVCKDNAPCNKSTGKCDNGCDDHWTGKFCEGT